MQPLHIALRSVIRRHGVAAGWQADVAVELFDRAIEQAYQQGWEQGFDDANRWAITPESEKISGLTRPTASSDEEDVARAENEGMVNG